MYENEKKEFASLEEVQEFLNQELDLYLPEWGYTDQEGRYVIYLSTGGTQVSMTDVDGVYYGEELQEEWSCNYLEEEDAFGLFFTDAHEVDENGDPLEEIVSADMIFRGPESFRAAYGSFREWLASIHD